MRAQHGAWLCLIPLFVKKTTLKPLKSTFLQNVFTGLCIKVFGIMPRKVKKTKKSDQLDLKRVTTESKQGMAHANSQPTGIYTNLTNLSNINTQPSSLIQQSNELLYGNLVNMRLPLQMPPTPPAAATVQQQHLNPMMQQSTYQQQIPVQNTPISYPNLTDPKHVQSPQQQQSFQQNFHTSDNYRTGPTITSKAEECSIFKLSSILQSLDAKLGKIETHLGFQNQQLDHQNSRIQNIEQHVEQITVLKQSMASVQSKLYTVENEVTKLKTNHIEYDKSIETYSDLCDNVLKTQSKTNERLDTLNAKVDFLLNSEIETMKIEHNDLKEDFLDSKCRPMCENLI